jgi:hypothetical protein
MAKTRTRTITLLDLVRTVQDIARSDREVVAVVAHLFRSRSVVLARNHAAGNGHCSSPELGSF